MAAFRNIPAHPIQLKGECCVAFAEILVPTSIENNTMNEYFVNTPKEVVARTRHWWSKAIARELGRRNAEFPS